MIIEDLARQYLSSFENRDLGGISKLMSDEVILRDWEVIAEGKESVLATNKKIFESFREIELSILNIISSSTNVLVEFSLNLISESGLESLLVADVIEFGNDGLISEVRAYRGN